MDLLNGLLEDYSPPGSSRAASPSDAGESPGVTECRWGGVWPLAYEADRSMRAAAGGGSAGAASEGAAAEGAAAEGAASEGAAAEGAAAEGAASEGAIAEAADEVAPLVWDPALWDARAVVAHNDAFRRLDGPSGLLRLGACDAAAPVYRAELPTFVPSGWRGVPRPLPGPEAAAAAFTAAHPQVTAALRAARGRLGAGIGAAAAGGAAAGALADFAPGDVDIFLWGPGLADAKARWRGLHCLVLQLRRAFLSPAPQSFEHVVEVLAPGVLSLVFTRFRPQGESRVQVILRAYPALSAVLHGFDLPSCAVAFDGADFFLTAAARFALAFRLNPVVPAYRSPTYEARLAKYFSRGFGVVLMDLRREALADSVVELPFLVLRPSLRCTRLPLASGVLAGRGPAPASDYLPDDCFATATRSFNLAAVLRALGPFGAPAAPPVLRIYAEFSLRDSYWRFRCRRGHRETIPPRLGIPFARFAEEGGPGPDALVGGFDEYLRRRAARAFQPGGTVNTLFLRDGLGMSHAEISACIESFLATPAPAPAPPRPAGRRRSPARRGAPDFRLVEALEPFRGRRLAQFAALPPPPPWWVIDNPAAQFSGSFQPRHSTVAEWYGDYAASAASAASAGAGCPDSLELDRLYAEEFDRRNRSAVYASGVCSICMDAVEAGQANSVVLCCGHVYHAARSAGCNGVTQWLATHHNRCPYCRTKIAVGGDSDSSSADSA